MKLLKLSSLLVLAVFLVACATDTDVTKGWPVEKIYEEARSEMTSGLYEKAIGLYEKLEGRAAGTVLAQQAQLEKAYAQYKNNEPILAVATLDRFIRLNPTNSALDYALYLKGTVNFNDDLGILGGILKTDLSERDQLAAKQSFESFKELATRFPESKYASDARARMQYIINVLARSELNVAKYYQKTGACVAAVNRAQTVLQDFPASAVTQDALNVLITCYDRLGLSQLRDDHRRILSQSFSKEDPATQMTPPVVANKDVLRPPWWKIW